MWISLIRPAFSNPGSVEPFRLRETTRRSLGVPHGLNFLIDVGGGVCVSAGSSACLCRKRPILVPRNPIELNIPRAPDQITAA
jgi:hypothetical protein